MQRHPFRSGQGHIVYDPRWLTAAPPELFDPHHLNAQGLLSSFGSGRGAVWLFRHEGHDFALRHYHRGGKMAPLLRDRYLYLGLNRTRPAREARILEWMVERGLPVPSPAAWRVVRDGPFYCADLIMTRIPHARSLSQVLRDENPGPVDWKALGRMLRRFHDLQVWHADLNLGNILQDTSGAFYVVDFDRCRVRRGRGWKQRNLARLHRSCLKEKTKSPDLHFRPQDFEALLRGYA